MLPVFAWPYSRGSMASFRAIPTVFFSLAVFIVRPSDGYLDQGQWEFALKSKTTFIVVSKAMYAGSNASIHGESFRHFSTSLNGK